ncbi:hypothetical protein BT96DRAFT_1044875 [Gymnopus androsaceus JB14]|uniref:Uncharacterized protein n=1 Tax=Gymnopus androsaceus JB14 TaxID=1447944 RepID=A0A6A4HAC7_9AGAR|nr:hypothetical protein BT96DRAFT_1044875 [Gymnopus androsaceus JB14]
MFYPSLPDVSRKSKMFIPSETPKLDSNGLVSNSPTRGQFATDFRCKNTKRSVAGLVVAVFGPDCPTPRRIRRKSSPLGRTEQCLDQYAVTVQRQVAFIQAFNYLQESPGLIPSLDGSRASIMGAENVLNPPVKLRKVHCGVEMVGSKRH